MLSETYGADGLIDISRKVIGTFVEEAKVAESDYEAIKEVQEATPGVYQTLLLPLYAGWRRRHPIDREPQIALIQDAS